MKRLDSAVFVGTMLIAAFLLGAMTVPGPPQIRFLPISVVSAPRPTHSDLTYRGGCAERGNAYTCNGNYEVEQ